MFHLLACCVAVIFTSAIVHGQGAANFTSHGPRARQLSPVGSVMKDEESVNGLERGKRWAAQTPPSGIAKLIALDVICGKDHMTVRAEFNGPFQGLVFSKGTFGQDNCVYVKPHSGVTHSTFKVNYDACGTKPDLQGKYYENTIVIQYGTDIIEAWDEAKRLRCEWFEAYEKPATFRPAIPVADLDVVEMNFQGDDIDCWMEIQEGKGPWAREVNRIVPVGQPMTIVVSINDYNGQFDMRVKSCFAHDGIKPPIHLTDEHGCVLRTKMLSGFNKIKDPNGKATVISYSHFYAFKFPDTMNVQIQCTVEVCRHGCPDACQKGPYPAPVREIHPKVQIGTSEPAAKPDEEPKPTYQDVAGSSRVPVHLPGISDPAIINHAASFLESQGVDLSKLHHESIFGEESRDHISVHGSQSNEKVPIFSSDISVSSESGSAEDGKPVIKVVEVDVPNDKNKSPTITDHSSMFPSDLNQASKLLADLGLNMDLSAFAAGLSKNPKDLQSLLQNDQIRQLAAASGIPINGPTFVPESQPLSNMSSIELVETTTKQNFYESGTETPYASSVAFNTTKSPFIQGPIQVNPQHHQQFIQQHVRPQQHQQQPPRQMQRPHQGPPRMQPPHGFPPQQGPVVQVLNIPMAPGMHMPPQMPPSFTNFIHHQQPPQSKPKRPLFFPSFSLPHLPLPSLSALNPFAAQSAHWKDRNDQQSNGMQPRSDNFPQGPRSMRLRRSVKDGNIAVNKVFQVVTTMDLAFSPTSSADGPQVFEGRREVNGVCLPMFGFAAAITCVVLMIVCAVAFSIAMIHRIRKRSSKLAVNQMHLQPVSHLVLS